MKSNTESKIHDNDKDWHAEFVDEDSDESSLEDVGVEEEQKYHHHSKQDAHVLNDKNDQKDDILEVEERREWVEEEIHKQQEVLQQQDGFIPLHQHGSVIYSPTLKHVESSPPSGISNRQY